MREPERSMRDRMLAGEPYLADDPVLIVERARAAELVEAFNRTAAAYPDTRHRLMRELLGAYGEDCEIRPPIFVDYGYPIRVGARVFVNVGLVALDVASIVIGDDVQIGPNVQLLAAEHPLAPGPRRDKWESGRPIVLGDNVWLGGRVVVCPGVTIGANTVVGAGSVVTGDLPPDVLAVGSPARVLRALPERAGPA